LVEGKKKEAIILQMAMIMIEHKRWGNQVDSPSCCHWNSKVAFKLTMFLDSEQCR